MRDYILKAVAQPPKFLFAPFELAVVNLGIQFPMLFLGIGFAEVNPLAFIFSIALAHGLLVYGGQKEPHLATMLRAYGLTYKRTTNLYAVKGNKFEP